MLHKGWLCSSAGPLIGAVHASGHSGSGGFLGRKVSNHALSGGHEGGNTGGVAESGTDNLEGIENTSLEHVLVGLAGGIETHLGVVLLEELVDDDAAVDAGVLGDGLAGNGDGLLDDVDTDLLVEVSDGLLELVEASGGVEEGGTTSGKNTLGDGGTSGVEGVLETVLLLVDLDLGGSADLDDGDTAGELGESLVELLLLVGGGGLALGLADGLAAVSNGLAVAGAVEDDGLVLVDGDLLAGAEEVDGGVLELLAELGGDELAAGEDGEILEGGLAVVTEAGGLDGGDLHAAAELVEDEGGEGLAFNVLSDDEEGLLALVGGLEDGEDGLDGADLAVVEEDEGVLVLALHGLGVGEEVGRDVAAIELHTLDDLELVGEGGAVLDVDDALLADLLHGLGDELTDLVIVVGGDGGDVLDLLVGADGLGHGLEVLDDVVDGDVDTASEVHGVHASGDGLAALVVDGAGEDGGGGGTITGALVGLAGDLADEGGTHVLELVLEIDGLGDGDTILCDLGGAVGLVNDDVSALGAEGGFYGISELIDTSEHSASGLERGGIRVRPGEHGKHTSSPNLSSLPAAKVLARG